MASNPEADLGKSMEVSHDGKRQLRQIPGEDELDAEQMHYNFWKEDQ
jgi:hypothetical protein